jgi:ornithine cyclodeaminase
MSRMTILTEADLRRIVQLDLDAIACVENAFRALATLPVAMPPIMRLDIPEHRGEVDVKTAYVPGIDGFAIKISPGFFDNPKLGLPSLNGMMVLLSAKTGLVEALLLDNGYLTEVRTAAAGAVAAKHLARADASVVAVFGAGVQARLQLRALTLVRPRDLGKAEIASTELSRSLAIPVLAVGHAQKAAEGADVIITTTPAERPILSADWLQPGQHITAIGSDSEHKNEIDPKAFGRVVYVADSLKQTRRLGELHHAIAAGAVEATAKFAELGAVIAAKISARRSPDDVTLADLTGTGVQDTAIATLARDRARAANAGAIFES